MTEASQRLRVRWIVGLLLAVLSINFLTLPKWHYRGDALRARVASVNLINTGDISISADNATANSAGERGQYYFENVERGKWYSKYGILNTLVYVPPLVLEKLWRGGVLDYTHHSRARRFLLGTYNVLLSLGIVAYLGGLLSFYTKRPATKILYVLSVFYCTCMWNYLRAPSFEIFQILFFAGFYYHLAASKHCSRHTGEDGSPRLFRPHLLLAALFLACLCLTKLMFVLLIPIFCVFAVLADWNGSERFSAHVAGKLQKLWKVYACSMLIPIVMLCAIVLMINNYKFGSPLNTGYRQWVSNQNLFGGDIVKALGSFLFGFHTSIFLSFPVFAFSLPGLIFFSRKYKWDALLSWTIFLVFLVVISMFIDAGGSWSYGPRYILFMMPVVSIPFVAIIDRAIDSISAAGPASTRRPGGRMWRIASGTAVAVLLFSAYLQIGMNSMEFFTYYEARGLLENFYPALPDEVSRDITEYFDRTHPGTINRQIQAFRENGGEWPPMAMALPQLSAQDKGALKYYMFMRVMHPVNNNYFWLEQQDMDRAASHASSAKQLP